MNDCNFEPDYNFGPAAEDETLVFGARYPARSIDEWIAFMRANGIERVCCLLDYEDYIASYNKAFRSENVLFAPIRDYQLSSEEVLKNKILPFLEESRQLGKKTVIHCHSGHGRTGHVLAAWLVYSRGMPPEKAIEAVKASPACRKPNEAVKQGNATEDELLALLESCRQLNKR